VPSNGTCGVDGTKGRGIPMPEVVFSVEIPIAWCSLYLPTAIFDFDVRPNKDGPQMTEHGSAAKTS